MHGCVAFSTRSGSISELAPQFVRLWRWSSDVTSLAGGSLRKGQAATHSPQRFARPPEAPSLWRKKKLFTLLDLCVSSLRRGHANLLCIVPILTDDPRRESVMYPCPCPLVHFDSRICKDAPRFSKPALANIPWLTSAHIELEQGRSWLSFYRWGLCFYDLSVMQVAAPVALRGHGGEVLVNTLCPASHVDGLP